jgi:LEA14-like dessication related protein
MHCPEAFNHRMTKRYWAIIFAAVVVIAALLWWSSIRDRVHTLKPTIKVASISISAIHEQKIKCSLELILTNPLPVEVDIAKLEYQVRVDSMLLLESVYHRPIHIESSDSTRIILPMVTSGKRFERIINFFEEYDRDSALYSLRASFSADLPVAGVRKFRLQEEKRMPAIRIPKLEIDDVQIDKAGFHDSRLEMTVHIKNPGLLQLKLKDAGFSFAIDHILRMNGTPEKNIAVMPKGIQSVPVVLDIRTAKVVRLTWKVLFRKKTTDFEMNFHGTVVSEDPRVNNSYLQIAKRGTLDELQQSDTKK